MTRPLDDDPESGWWIEPIWRCNHGVCHPVDADGQPRIAHGGCDGCCDKLILKDRHTRPAPP